MTLLVISLLVVGPALAIAGVSAGGAWSWLGLAVASSLVAVTAFRVFRQLLGDSPRGFRGAAPVRQRAMASIVTLALFAAGAAIVAVVVLIRGG